MVSALPAVLLLVLWGVALVRQPCLPHAAALALAGNYLYWGVNLLSSGTPLQTLVSYDFMRWQSRIFVAFLPYFVFSTPHLPVHEKLTKRLAFLFLFASAATVLAGATQLLLGSSYSPRVGEHLQFRGIPVIDIFGDKWFVGFLRTHTAAGGFYLITTVLSLSLFLFERMKPRVRLVIFATFAVSLWGLVFTKARGAYVAFAVVFILILIVYTREEMKRKEGKRWDVFLPIIAVAMAVILSSFFVPGGLARMGIKARLPEQVTPSPVGTSKTEGMVQPHSQGLAEETAADRSIYWSAALKMFRERPIFGIGLGRFSPAFASEFGSALRVRILKADWYHAHNSYLQILAELGVFGIFLFTLFWALILKALFMILEACPPGDFARAFTLAAIFSTLAQLILGAVDYNWGAPSIMLPLAFLVGLALASTRTAEEEMVLSRSRLGVA